MKRTGLVIHRSEMVNDNLLNIGKPALTGIRIQAYQRVCEDADRAA